MKILHLDIETAYLIGATWQMWDTSVAQVLQDPYILGFGYSWNHLEGVFWVGMSDFPSFYKKDHTNDKLVMKELHKLLEEADVVVAHNGKQFDMKKIRGRLLMHGFPPLKRIEIVDTKLVAKQFGYLSNKLDELGRTLLGERKLKHDGIELWTRCMARKIDHEAWQQMETYCIQDVALLKRLYQKFLPWIENHPNWNVHTDGTDVCTNCGSVQIVKDGQRYNRTTVVQQYRCRSCRHVMLGKSRRLTDIR